MIVCHCHALTDRDIRATAQTCGACPNAVRSGCGAGDACGGCTPQVELIVKSIRLRQVPPARQRAPLAI